MNVKYCDQEKIIYFDLTEEIDHHTTEKIRRECDYEIERHMPRKIIFNLNRVTFMDSAGIGMLLRKIQVNEYVTVEIWDLLMFLLV